MVQGYKCKKTRQLAEGTGCDRRFAPFRDQAEKRIRILEAATRVEDLMLLRSNRFEALGGSRQGQYSIRINDQWRLCFRWGPTGPFDVEIVDYH